MKIKREFKIIGSILAIALPTIIDLFAQTLLSSFDLGMVEKLGIRAINAVGTASIPFLTVIPIIFAISIGTTAIISRAYGLKNREEGKETLAQSLILALPISILIILILFIFKEEIILFAGKGKVDYGMTSSYYDAILMGTPFLCFNIIFFAAYRSTGKAYIPMLSNMVTVILNIILNYIFIFTLSLGVFGAGIATTISRGVITLIFVYLTFFTNKFWVSLSYKHLLKIKKKMCFRIFKVGIPTAIEQGFFRVGMFLFEVMIINLGAIDYAAHKIALNAESYSYNMGFGFSVAASAIVGQQLGRNLPKKAKRDAFLTTKMAIILMSTFGFFFFLIPEYIASLFTTNKEVIKMASIVLRLISICQPFTAISMVLGGSLRGAGSTIPVLIITFIGMYLIRLPLTYYFLEQLKTGLAGAWVVMTIDLGFRSLACYLVFKAGKWAKNKV